MPDLAPFTQATTTKDIHYGLISQTYHVAGLPRSCIAKLTLISLQTGSLYKQINESPLLTRALSIIASNFQQISSSVPQYQQLARTLADIAGNIENVEIKLSEFKREIEGLAEQQQNTFIDIIASLHKSSDPKKEINEARIETKLNTLLQNLNNLQNKVTQLKTQEVPEVSEQLKNADKQVLSVVQSLQLPGQPASHLLPD